MRASGSLGSRAGKLHFLSEAHATLYRAVQEFTAMESLPGFARPKEPVALSAVFPGYEGPDDEDYPDRCGYPWGLCEDTMLSVSWTSFLGCVHEVEAVDLPGGHRVYLEFSEIQGNRLLAAATLSAPLADSRFVEALLTSNGAAFGTEIFGGPPDSVSVGGRFSREKWIEIFGRCFSAGSVWDDLAESQEPEDWYQALERIAHGEDPRQKPPAEDEPGEAARSESDDASETELEASETEPEDPDEELDDGDLDDEELDDEDAGDWFSDANLRRLVEWFLEDHGIVK